jgi:hypothetical protein
MQAENFIKAVDLKTGRPSACSGHRANLWRFKGCDKK